MNAATPRERLIVALDVPDVAVADALVGRLGDAASFYKIGLELVMTGGLDLARRLKRQGRGVFLDMKLLDIPNTVERAVANAANVGVDFLTIHGIDRKTMAAAVKGRGTSSLRILGVTVLTSLSAEDVAEQGVCEVSPGELVLRRAALARDAGLDGVVASGQEAKAVRAIAPAPFLIVTPGIRPSGADAGDQARVTTPAAAIRDGATYIVVGRPITAAADPRAAALAITADIAAAAAQT
jgi:orotidine-5'-phosphate decarboxylase